MDCAVVSRSFCILAVLCLAIPFNLQAQAISDFTGPQEFSEDFETVRLMGESFNNLLVWNREDFPEFGGTFRVTIQRDDATDTVRNPSDGDEWSLTFIDPQGRIAPVPVSWVYDADSDCILFQGELPVICDVAIPEGERKSVTYSLIALFEAPCLTERTSGFLLDARLPVKDVEGSPFEFIPTSFLPAISEIQVSPEKIQPELPGDPFLEQEGFPNPPVEPESAVVQVVVTDDRDCGRRLGGVEVELENTVVPGSGGHAHFDDESEPGTGIYPEAEDTEAVPPTIEGVTDTDGIFEATYTAGEFGVKERIVVHAERALFEPPELVEAQEQEGEITIRVPGLVDFSDGLWGEDEFRNPGEGDGRTSKPHPEHGFIISFGGGCPHDPPAVWATLELRDAIVELNEKYEEIFEADLSFNDGSLKFGGKIDHSFIGADDGGRDTSCHDSHRRGEDIDPNGTDIDGTNIWTAVDNGIPRYRALREIARNIDLAWVDSDGLHFRWIEGYSDEDNDDE